MKTLQSPNFKKFSEIVFNELLVDEAMTMTLSAEETQFSRITNAKIRQSTNVHQAFIECNFIKGNKTLNFHLPFRATDEDVTFFVKKIKESREWIRDLPEDPYLVRPAFYGVTEDENLIGEACESSMLLGLLDEVGYLDLAGMFASGDLVRATTNSMGQYHWFKTRNFYLDYSLYNKKQKAVKSLFAGKKWDTEFVKQNILDSEHKLSMMNRESRKIERGTYRVFLAPACVSELLGTLSWNGVSMGAHQRGHGSLKDLWEKKRTLSPQFTLKEDFSLGMSPRFNNMGEVSSSEMTIIEKGELKNFLISTRTANEYKLQSNFATEDEGLRSPVVETGTLSRENILKSIGTGLYLSDLHYLNWSDRETARFTGMTRYACFWVENGEIVSPIEDLRFDESFYSLFGDKLVDLTDYAEIHPNTGSYFQRDVGGTKTPGILVDDFKFTL